MKLETSVSIIGVDLMERFAIVLIFISSGHEMNIKNVQPLRYRKSIYGITISMAFDDAYSPLDTNSRSLDY